MATNVYRLRYNTPLHTPGLHVLPTFQQSPVHWLCMNVSKQGGPSKLCEVDCQLVPHAV